MKYITFLNILSKLVFTIAIFVFVKNQSDYWKVPLLNSIGFTLAGMLALWIVLTRFKIGFTMQTLDKIRKHLIDGWYIFLSRVAVVLYTSSNIFILGLFANNRAVGYYSIAENLVFATSSMASIVTNALFPYLSKLWQTDRNEYYTKFNVVFKLLLGLMSVILLIVYIFSEDIIYLISGHVAKESVVVLRILVFAALLYPTGSLFTESFVSQGKSFYVSRITIYTSIANFILAVPLIYIYEIYGLALAVVIVQIFHFILNYIYFTKLKRNGI